MSNWNGHDRLTYMQPLDFCSVYFSCLYLMNHDVPRFTTDLCLLCICSVSQLFILCAQFFHFLLKVVQCLLISGLRTPHIMTHVTAKGQHSTVVLIFRTAWSIWRLAVSCQLVVNSKVIYSLTRVWVDRLVVRLNAWLDMCNDKHEYYAILEYYASLSNKNVWRSISN